MLTGYQGILINYAIQSVAPKVKAMVQAVINSITDAAIGSLPALRDRRDSVMSSFETTTMALPFTDPAQGDARPKGSASVAGRLTAGGRRSWGRIAAVLGLGMFSGGLYGGLYFFESDVIALTAQGGGFSTALLVAGAFAFSIVHGAFTGRFWDLIGIKAKK